MPLYEYQCDACGNRFEAIQKFSDPPLEVCPRCGGAVKKLQSAPAFQFKGSGWYITDYARKDQGGGEKKGDKKDDTKSDTTEKTDGARPAADKAGESSKAEAKSEKPASSPPAKES
jgi:putative FmdB family regulatory protein